MFGGLITGRCRGRGQTRITEHAEELMKLGMCVIVRYVSIVSYEHLRLM